MSFLKTWLYASNWLFCNVEERDLARALIYNRPSPTQSAEFSSTKVHDVVTSTSAKALHPCEHSLDLPVSPISTHRSTVLGGILDPVGCAAPNLEPARCTKVVDAKDGSH